MPTARRMLSLACCAALFASTAAQAQNLLQNPYFDDNLNFWEHDPPGQVSWTNAVDYPTLDSHVPGAMALDGSRGPVLAYQCVPVADSLDYLASVRVQSHCAGQTLSVFWTDSGCAAGASFISAASTHADTWDLISLIARPAAGATRAIVVVENPTGCATPAYVDDVVFQTDLIFADGFELSMRP